MRRALSVLGLILALLLAAFPAPRVSAYTGALTQTYCQNTLNGTWSGGVCTISTGTSTLPAGDTVTVDAFNELAVSSGATLNVNGELRLQTGELSNQGTVNVGGTGSIVAYQQGSFGWASVLQNDGSISNVGEIRIAQDMSGGDDAVLRNGTSGTIVNDGTLTISSNDALNGGSLTNNAALLINSGGRLENEGSLTNASSVSVWGVFSQPAIGASFLNESAGTIRVFAGGDLIFLTGSAINNGSIESSNGSSMWFQHFTNHQTVDGNGTVFISGLNGVENAVGADMDLHGPTTVEGSFTNRGSLESTDRLTVTGSLDNYGTYRNTGSLHIGGDPSPEKVMNLPGATFDHGGTMTADGPVHGYVFVNDGILRTYGASTIDLPASVPIDNNGTVEHYGRLETASYVDNYDGVINEYCGSAIQGSVAGGTRNDLCVGTVIVEKSAVGGDATFSYTGSGEGIAASFDVATSGGTGSRTFSNVAAQEVKVIEEAAPPAHWTFTSLSCTSSEGSSVITETNRTAEIYLEDGDTVTCEYVNTRDARVIVEKAMAGGTGTFSFSGTPSGSIATDGGTLSAWVAPGRYTSTEEPLPSDWTLTDISCDDGDSTGDLNSRTATFNAAAGEVVRCTFTNAQDGRVIVDKVTDPAGSQESFSFETTGADYSGFSLTDGEENDQRLAAGDYSVTEDVPPGWDLTDVSCTSTLGTSTITESLDAASVALAAGDTVRCTFTNTQRGSIVVEKTTEPAGEAESFPFTTGGAGYSSFSLTDGEQNDQELAAGDYSVTEDVPPGWDLTDLSCTSTLGTSTITESTDTASVTLAAADTVRCTFTNTRRGNVVVEKVTDPAGEAESFPFTTGGAGYSSFSLTDGEQNDQELAAGGYTLAEDVPAGWELTGLSCASDGGTSTITETAPGVALDLAPADTVRCTFTNTQQGTIVVQKTTDPAGGSGFVFSDTIAAPYSFSLGDGESETFTPVSPGSYVITETVAWGWVITDVVCSDGSSTAVDLGTAAVDLEPGELVTCTFSNQALDSDGDGVPDYVEGRGDRDDDGIPNYEDYDPTGYLYDEETGRILSGGLITVTGPTTVTLLQDGSTGFYQFDTVQPTGTYTIAVELPPGYALSHTCQPQDPPPFDPTGGPNPTVLGSSEVSATGHLTPTACTPYYLSFNLQPEDPSVLNNNIPLRSIPPVGGATMAPNRWRLLAVEVNLAVLTVIVVAVGAIIKSRGD